MRKNKWIVTAKRADFNRISQECGISPILARLIRNRDVIGTDGTMRFLKGGLKDLYDPRLLPDAEKAAEILARKIREGKRIRIIGDYDVDGICSSYILWYSLCQFGGHADAVLPERLTDGYGINERLVRDAADHGVDTILTCDNGIAASDPLRTAGELGMTVIVTDHHEVPFKVRPDGTRSWIIPPAHRNTASWKDIFFPLPASRRYATSCPFAKRTGSLYAKGLKRLLFPGIRDCRRCCG